jgi:LEA14-like dessication related protein
MRLIQIKKQGILLNFAVMMILAVVCLASCEKQFNPRDKYKDITVVYGLINPEDTVHYLRINKAFLGDESIIIMAQNPDSSTYPVNDIDVRVYEDSYRLSGSCPFFFDTILEKSHELTVETKMMDKYTGVFYPKQRVYYFTKIFDLPYNEPENVVNKIRVEITNNKTGKITYGETQIINTWKIESPMPGSRPNFNPSLAAMQFKWKNANHGRIYDVYYTIHYTEAHYGEKDTTKFQRKSLTCHLGSYTAPKTGDVCTTTSEVFSFSPSSLYSEIIKTIPYDESVWRLPNAIAEVSIWCGSEDMYYYNNINDPSSGWIQDRPEYTNLKTKLDSVNLSNESFGLLSSRLIQKVNVALSNDMIIKYLPETGRQFVSKRP